MVCSKKYFIYFSFIHEYYKVPSITFVLLNYISINVFNACNCRTGKQQGQQNIYCLWQCAFILFPGSLFPDPSYDDCINVIAGL